MPDRSSRSWATFATALLTLLLLVALCNLNSSESPIVSMSPFNFPSRQRAVDASLDDFSARYFTIQVVDADTNRGIPLVYLRTTYRTVYMTDSAGYVAFYVSHLPGCIYSFVMF